MKMHTTLLGAAIAGSMLIAGTAVAQDMQDRSERTVAAQSESDQPVSDTWITTKVKADLLASSDVAGLDIKVETTNGTVSLSGDVESQAQIARAKAIATDIEGVTRVDTAQLKVGPAN